MREVGTALRNFWRRSRFSPVTQETRKIGAKLHEQEKKCKDIIHDSVIIMFLLKRQFIVAADN